MSSTNTTNIKPSSGVKVVVTTPKTTSKPSMLVPLEKSIKGGKI